MNYSTCVATGQSRAVVLQRMVEQHFGHPLNRLHELLECPVARLEVGRDQQTQFHKKFYEIGADFWEEYKNFARHCAERIGLGDPAQLLYQRRPTFRVHLPGNVATGGWHRDGDYNHPSEELNFVVPLTRFIPPSPEGHAGNGFFIADRPWLRSRLLRRFVHPDMEPGDVLRFHGAALLHGSVENRTGLTRVSLDFRVLPKTAVPTDGKSTVNQGIPFKVGPDGYYDTFD